MARAKRTDKAEARRKNRAYLQAQQEAAAGDGGLDDVPVAGLPKTYRTRDLRPQSEQAPSIRMGMVAAARGAYRNPTYISDIRYIRTLVFRTNAVWPILAVCAAAAAYTTYRLSQPGYNSDPILPLLGQFLWGPVPFLPPMLAGFLAPRATWLAGMVAAFLSTMSLVVVLAITAGRLSSTTGEITVGSTPSPSFTSTATLTATPSATVLVTSTPTPSSSPSAGPSRSPSPSASPAGSSTGSSGYTTSDLINVMVVLLAQSLTFGALMGALSGWYKRFLALTSGPRKPRTPKSGSGRSPQRRRSASAKS